MIFFKMVNHNVNGLEKIGHFAATFKNKQINFCFQLPCKT
jgi:hypothetical protein